jgi:anthranilate synthase component 1
MMNNHSKWRAFLMKKIKVGIIIGRKIKELGQMVYPSLEEVKELAKSYNKIPLGLEVYMDIKTPIALLAQIRKESSAYFLFESIEGEDKNARYSFIGFNPKRVFSCKNGECTLEENGKEVFRKKSDPYVLLKDMMAKEKSPVMKELPPFNGGAVGYFAYETSQYVHPISFTNQKAMDLPDILLLFFDEVIAFDRYEEKIVLIAHINTEEGSKKPLDVVYEKAKQKIENLYEKIKAPSALTEMPYEEPLVAKPLIAKEEHIRRVERIKEYIRAGDIFQAVLSQRFAFQMKEDLFGVYRVLRKLNPSPYMYMIRYNDLEIAGASPELLVKVTDGTITNMPIAGTRKRGKTKEEDLALEQELLADEKELAEHNMLVDLGRNDVGSVSEFNSVVVKEYMKMKRFSHVMHITSQVEGTIKKDLSPLDALKYILPAGTLSGAPKLRAMEIIEELEDTRRGVYGGAIGYIGYDGNLDTCIAIRTIVKHRQDAFIQAGGGIVLDSNGEDEYEETCNKAGALFEAIKKVGEIR